MKGSLNFNESDRLLRKMQNNRGPSREPCGTPLVTKSVLMITHELHKMIVERLIHAFLKKSAVYVKEGYSAIVAHQFPVNFFVDGTNCGPFPLLGQSF